MNRNFLNSRRVKKNKLSEKIHKNLVFLIQKEIKFSKVCLITISSVELYNFNKFAKVFFTIIKGNKKKISSILNNKSKFIRFKLHRILKTYSIPSLHFIYSKNYEKFYKIKQIVDYANQTNFF